MARAVRGARGAARAAHAPRAWWESLFFWGKNLEVDLLRIIYFTPLLNILQPNLSPEIDYAANFGSSMTYTNYNSDIYQRMLGLRTRAVILVFRRR